VCNGVEDALPKIACHKCGHATDKTERRITGLDGGSAWRRYNDFPRMSRPPLLIGIGLAALLTFSFRWLNLTEFVNDHFDHVSLAQQLLLGALPVRDFVDEGMPLMYALSAGAWAVVKSPFLAEALVVGLGFAIAAALSFRLAALLTGSLMAAAVAVAAQVALNPRTYSYPKLFVHAVALTVAWWAVKSLTWRRIAALSAATALGYYFRHDHALYIGAATVALLVVAQWRTGLATVARSVVLFGALAFAFVVPHLAYVQWAAGLPHYLQVIRQYVSTESESGAYRVPVPSLDASAGLWMTPETRVVHVRWTPAVDDRTRTELEKRYSLAVVKHVEDQTWRYRVRDTSADNLRHIRSDPHVEDTHGFDQLGRSERWNRLLTEWQLGPGWRARENSVALIFWLYWILPPLGLAMVMARRREIGETAVVVMLCVLALCANFVFLRAPLEARLPDVGLSQTVLAAWVAVTAWRWWPAPGTRRRVTRFVVAAATVTTVMAVALFGHTGQLLTATGVFDGPRGVARQWRDITARLKDDKPGPVPSYPSSVLLPFIEYVRACTAPTDRVLYGWYSLELNVVTGRGFAGDYRRFYRRLNRDEQAMTIARLQHQSVPLVVLPVDRRQWFAKNYPDLWRYLQTRYVLMATIPPNDERGFEILREASPSGTSVYKGTNWPCLR